MRIVFMGTPEIAAAILADMAEAGYQVAAAVTQPDKPKGRGKELSCPEVKKTAFKYGIKVYQPARVREEGFLEEMERISPDLIVVAAFGQILPKRLLEIPKYGCINVHASLLPKYRGASPIQWAIMNGEKETGVTIMHMEEGLDTGDVITKETVAISEDETGGSLHDKLAKAGSVALLRAIAQIKAGTAARVPQDEAAATYVGMIKKEMGALDFSRSAAELERMVRGLNPWPSAHAFLSGKILKIWGSRAVEPSEALLQKIRGNSWTPGTVVEVEKDFFSVLTGNGCLAVTDLQLEGKRRMPAKEFLRGFLLECGTKLERSKG